jgi:hypothetical protein
MAGFNKERETKDKESGISIAERLLDDNRLCLSEVSDTIISHSQIRHKYIIHDAFPRVQNDGIMLKYASFKEEPTHDSTSIHFDKSFASLNLNQKYAVMRALFNINKEFPGKTVVTHDIELIDPIAMKVAQILLIR